MKTTCDFLDAVKSRYGLKSDYALAKKLVLTTQQITQYRNKGLILSDAMAIKVAELLEIDPALVIIAVHGERAKKDSEKAVWESIMQKLGGAAAALFIGIGGLSAPAPAQAAQAPEFNAQKLSIMRCYVDLQRSGTALIRVPVLFVLNLAVS